MNFANDLRQGLLHGRLRLTSGRRGLSSTRKCCPPVRLSTQYIPTLRSDELAEEHLDSVKLLLQGGYIRQSSSGFYTLLPLGLRLVKKIENIVDEEMEKVRRFLFSFFFPLESIPDELTFSSLYLCLIDWCIQAGIANAFD